MTTRARLRWCTSVLAVAGLAVPLTGRALAHGSAPAEPPTATTLLLGWTFAPIPTFGIAVAVAWWLWAVRRVDAAHLRNPVPARRTLAFLAGMAAMAVALISGIERYDTTLFSIHMVQHILLALVAAPLIALSAPVTLLLRLVSPANRRWLIRILHTRLVRIVSFPVTAWVVFAAVMWVSHFSALFDAALETPLLHDLEHGLFLGSALLFWWPAAGQDPAPFRLGHPARIGYLFLQMTQNTFLAVVILNAPAALYSHYATLGQPYGVDALADQRVAAGIMWLAGDAIFLGAIMLLVVGWMRAEARGTARADRAAAAELARIRVRERKLADRLAQERGERRG